MKETKIKKVYRNICLTEWGVKETQEARKDIYNISNRIDDISSRIGDIEKKINCIYKNSNELVFRIAIGYVFRYLYRLFLLAMILHIYYL